MADEVWYLCEAQSLTSALSIILIKYSDAAGVSRISSQYTAQVGRSVQFMSSLTRRQFLHSGTNLQKLVLRCAFRTNVDA